jgi:hypothetical protein
MPLDVTANRFHQFELRIAADRRGTAAQARAVSGMFGFDCGAEETDIFPPRSPRRARRTAEHSSRRNRKDEAVVEAGIAVNYRLPAPFVGVVGHHAKF